MVSKSGLTHQVKRPALFFFGGLGSRAQLTFKKLGAKGSMACCNAHLKQKTKHG